MQAFPFVMCICHTFFVSPNSSYIIPSYRRYVDRNVLDSFYRYVFALYFVTILVRRVLLKNVSSVTHHCHYVYCIASPHPVFLEIPNSTIDEWLEKAPFRRNSCGTRLFAAPEKYPFTVSVLPQSKHL